MCRKNLVLAAGLLGFGAGLVTGCCTGWCFASVCLAAAAIGGGLCLGKRR